MHRPDGSRRLKGSHWSDLAHIYAVAAAGYVPEVFGLPFTSGFVHDLLDDHHAPVLIYDALFETQLGEVQWGQCTIALPKLTALPAPAQISAPPEVDEDDVAMIFHTSGTTGGRPKPVPQTHKWLIAEAEVTWKCVIQIHPEGQQHVFNNIGSFASIGAASCTRSRPPLARPSRSPTDDRTLHWQA